MERGGEELILRLIEKSSTFDKDERYMATSDLCGELSKGSVELGLQLQIKVCTAILNQLNDNSNDVQSIAVKCLGILVTKVSDRQAADIAGKLCDLILHGQAELHDIYTIGIKTILADIDISAGVLVSKTISAQYLHHLSRSNSETRIKADLLDTVSDVFRRFGNCIDSDHETYLKLFLTDLNDPSYLIRKRTIQCIGSLGLVISDELLAHLIDELRKRIDSGYSDMPTLIQTIGTLSRTCGHRLSTHFDTIIPLLIQFCGNVDDSSMQNSISDELRENCIQAFESFFTNCHEQISNFTTDIVTVLLQCISYDPNFNYEDEDEEMDESEQEFSEQEYSDDDDTSWKVRRASVRVLLVAMTRPESFGSIQTRAMEQLIDRLKEREENVRVDVFRALTQFIIALRTHSNRNVQVVDSFRQQIQTIISCSTRYLTVKTSIACRRALLQMLCEVAHLNSGQLSCYFQVLVPTLLHALEDKHTELKLETLTLLRLLVDTHNPESVYEFIPQIVCHCVDCVQKEWYKVVAKALDLIQSLVRVLENSQLASTYAPLLLDAVLPHLETKHTDQEIKEAAIHAAGRLLCSLSGDLGGREQEVLLVLSDLIRNENTRVHAMKAIASISERIDISAIKSDVIKNLALLLRQQSRTLKQIVLQTIIQVTSSQGAALDHGLVEIILTEACVLLNGSDFQLCRLAIELVCAIMCTTSIHLDEIMYQRILEHCLQLAKNNTLQGECLDALERYFTQIAKFSVSVPKVFEALCDSPDASKQTLIHIARCVAALCSNCLESDRSLVLQSCLQQLDAAHDASTEKNAMLALFCIGEIGRNGVIWKDFENGKEFLFRYFTNGSEEMKTAAAFTLGNLCNPHNSGCLELISSQLEGSEHTYLVLCALRQAIGNCLNGDWMGPSARILAILKRWSDSEDEGIRNMVAECLGKLVFIRTSDTVKCLEEMNSKDASNRARWTAITALRAAITSPCLDEKHVAVIQAVFCGGKPLRTALNDEDFLICRAALMTLNAFLHHYPDLAYDYVKDLMERVLRTLTVKCERVVDLGPFKHKVDDGVAVRKAGFLCVETVLTTQAHHILDCSVFESVIEQGLSDQEDIQMQCHGIISKLCQVKPICVVQSKPVILTALRKTINQNVAEDQVGTHLERTRDAIRSALRVLEGMRQISEVNKCGQFVTVMEDLTKKPQLRVLYDAIQKERSNG